jgi:putative nucleotidyltransferase with HDIG domain
MKEQDEALVQLIYSISDLPVLPDVAVDVLRLTSDPGVSITDLSEHIQQDPALTARILKVSNSPFYGLTQNVGTLKLALVILGVREVRNIVLGVSVFDSFSNSPAEPLTRSLWRHSVEVAALSKKLGATLAPGLQAEDFISGLLHDIGKLVLHLRFGNLYTSLLKQNEDGGDALCATEMKMLGFTHADAAAALASHWNLPPTLVDALRYHHACNDRLLAKARDPRLAALTRLANCATHEDFSVEDNPHPSITQEQEAWHILVSPNAPKTDQERAMLLDSFLAEIRRVPPLNLE